MDFSNGWSKVHTMQKTLFYLMSVILVACGGEEKVNLPEEPETPEAEIILADGTDVYPLLDASGGTVALHFTATADWSASVGNERAVSWITVSPSSGKAGDASVTVTVASNEGTDERTASVFLECGDIRTTIVVTQKQKDALIISQQSYEVPAGESVIDVEIEANVAFETTISDTWIELVDTRSMEKSVLSFRILANDGYEQRNGSILIRSGELEETVRIYQEGKEEEVLLLSEDLVEVGAAGGTVDVQLQWSVSYVCKPEADYSWISELATRAVSTHTLHFEVQPNDTYDMREARFVFIDETEAVSDTLTIRQYAMDEILVPSDPVVCEASAGTFPLEVSANVSYTVETDASWLKQVAGRALEQSTLYFSVEENTEAVMREGHIILSGNGIKRTVKVMQKGKEEAPYLIVSQDLFNVQADGGIIRFTISGNVPYRVSTEADWISRMLSGTSEEEAVFTVLRNESVTGREAEITVASEDGSLVRTVRVVQSGASVYLEVTPSDIAAPSEGGRYAFTVDSNVEYTLICSDESWIRIDGNEIVVAPNEITAQRRGNVTVQTDSLVRVIDITQLGRKEETPSAGGSIEDFTENEEDW